MLMFKQCLSSLNSMNSVNSVNSVNHVNSVNNVSSVNNVNSVSNVNSIQRGATSISGGIFFIFDNARYFQSNMNSSVTACIIS